MDEKKAGLNDEVIDYLPPIIQPLYSTLRMLLYHVGAYKIMKGQIKTTMLMSKPYILQTVDKGATFPIKHDAIRAMKLEIKGNFNERKIYETSVRSLIKLFSS